MNKQKFIELLKEYLEIEDSNITVDTELKALPKYDSMTIMIIISVVDDHFKKTISAQQLNKISTIKDLMELIGIENFAD
jgi:acyl carrier protein